jgi:hypothetical protein
MIYLGKTKRCYPVALLKAAPFLIAGLASAALVPPTAPLDETLMALPPLRALGLFAALFAVTFVYVRWRGPVTVQSTIHQLKQAAVALPFSTLGLFV